MSVSTPLLYSWSYFTGREFAFPSHLSGTKGHSGPSFCPLETWHGHHKPRPCHVSRPDVPSCSVFLCLCVVCSWGSGGSCGCDREDLEGKRQLHVGWNRNFVICQFDGFGGWGLLFSTGCEWFKWVLEQKKRTSISSLNDILKIWNCCIHVRISFPQDAMWSSALLLPWMILVCSVKIFSLYLNNNLVLRNSILILAYWGKATFRRYESTLNTMWWQHVRRSAWQIGFLFNGSIFSLASGCFTSSFLNMPHKKANDSGSLEISSQLKHWFGRSRISPDLPCHLKKLTLFSMSTFSLETHFSLEINLKLVPRTSTSLWFMLPNSSAVSILPRLF